jgi:hypothetical protein
MSKGFAAGRHQTRLEWQADQFDEIADKIEDGRLQIRGALPAAVKHRMRSKARRSRSGEQVYRKRKRSQSTSFGDMDMTEDDVDLQIDPEKL